MAERSRAVFLNENPFVVTQLNGGSKTQVAFHRSLVAVLESNSIWLTLGLRLAFRPKVSQIEGFGYFPKLLRVTCGMWPVC